MCPLLIDHLTRKAEYFLAVLNYMAPGVYTDRYLGVLREKVSWLRITKEHPEFIMHLLGPSERILLNTAQQFYSAFCGLLETARDLESMAESKPALFNTVNQSRTSLERDAFRRGGFDNRDFKQGEIYLV